MHGDFVKLVGKGIQKGMDTQLNPNQYSAHFVSAISLDANRVFIVYTPETSFKMYGTICTIESTNITKGEDIQLINNTYQTSAKLAVKLSENRVFVGYENSGDGNKLYGLVCTINGTSITVGTDTLLSTVQYSGVGFSIVDLSESKVFIGYSNKSKSVLYGLVCTVSENTITVGTQTTLASITNTGLRISIVALSGNKVFIGHSYYTEKLLYGLVCTINGTTITKGTDKELNSKENTGYNINVVALSETKICMIYGLNNYLYGMICTINGTGITKRTDIQLSLIPNLYYIRSVIFLNNKVFIVYSVNMENNSSHYYLCGMICIISENKITMEINAFLSKEQNSRRHCIGNEINRRYNIYST